MNWRLEHEGALQVLGAKIAPEDCILENLTLAKTETTLPHFYEFSPQTHIHFPSRIERSNKLIN